MKCNRNCGLRLAVVLIVLAAAASGAAVARPGTRATDPQQHRVQRSPDDTVVFLEEDDSPTTYSPAEKKCFAKKMVLFSGKCSQLGVKGPCKANEVLAMEKLRPDQEWQVNQPLRISCTPKPCSKDDEVYWPASGRCLKKSVVKSTFCNGPGHWELTFDAFGEAVCQCPSEKGVFAGNKGCYEYYQQGPCNNGESLTFDATTRSAKCTTDLCYTQNANANRKRREADNGSHHISHYQDTALTQVYTLENDDTGVIPSNAMETKFFIDEAYSNGGSALGEGELTRMKHRARRQVALEELKFAPINGTGECVEVGDATLCGSGKDAGAYAFGVDERLHIPKCTLINNPLHFIDGIPKCKTDDRNQCREAVKIEQENELEFLLDLNTQLKSKRDTRRRGSEYMTPSPPPEDKEVLTTDSSVLITEKPVLSINKAMHSTVLTSNSQNVRSTASLTTCNWIFAIIAIFILTNNS